jgi:hypothetical protein
MRRVNQRRVLLLVPIAGAWLYGRWPESLCRWHSFVLLIAVLALWGLLIKLRSENKPWLKLGLLLLGTGGLSNFLALAANRGFMPVLDPWARPFGCWKAAEATDHLLFLCDQIRLVGQNTVMEQIGLSLPDWPPLDHVRDFLMMGSAPASVGDLFIFSAVLVFAAHWIVSRRRRASKEVLNGKRKFSRS